MTQTDHDHRLRDVMRPVYSCVLLLLGLAVFGFGLNAALVAQSPMDVCSKRHSGNVCQSGETCLFFFCWDWETYWPAEGEGGGGSTAMNCSPGEPCTPT